MIKMIVCLMENVVKDYLDKELGQVRYIKKSGIRTLRITLRHFNGVRVTVPSRVSLRDAEAFVQSKRAWIKKHIEKIREQEQMLTVFAADKRYKTKFHSIRIAEQQKNKGKLVINNGKAVIYLPGGMNIKTDEAQQYARKLIEEVWRHEAKNYLPERVARLAGKYGFSYGKVFIRNTKTRWGSCSSANNINLNVHLMRLPGHLIDYVILHELNHTRHKNHGKEFWNTLDQITGNAKGLSKEIREYRVNIY